MLDPQIAKKSDEDFRKLCERTWFYNGDHERKIQGRMAILRDYMPELRELVKTDQRKIKPLVHVPPGDSEMEIVRASILKNRINGDHYMEVVEKCVADWVQEFERELIAAGSPPDKLLAELVDQLSMQILERSPTEAEAAEYLALSRTYVEKLGKPKAIQKLIQTFILSSEFAYRQEFGTGGPTSTGGVCFLRAMPATPSPTP